MHVIRILFLIAPVFLSLFWAVVLMRDKRQRCEPRLFLSKFMILVSLIFTAHFLYFAPLPDMYVFFDIPLQIAGSIIFPLYHIYFRLLTVDEKFSLRKHTRYIIFPLLIALLYCIAVALTPFNDYKSWLYQLPDLHSNAPLKFLSIMRYAIKLTFFSTLVISMISNYRLMRKYGHKAEQFYSDMQDAEQKNAKKIYYSFLSVGIVSLVIILIGRFLLIPHDYLIYGGWIMFTILIFIIGDSGIKQKMVNPSLEPVEISGIKKDQPTALSVKDSQELLRKITDEFITNKIFLNSELTILDLGKRTGSNRTYISTAINHQHNLNFCSFVNGFRIEELGRILRSNPELNNEELAQNCGFGSVSSMKRAIFSKTGESLKDFKEKFTREQRAAVNV